MSSSNKNISLAQRAVCIVIDSYKLDGIIIDNKAQFNLYKKILAELDNIEQNELYFSKSENPLEQSRYCPACQKPTRT